MTVAIHTAKRVPPIDYSGVPLNFHGKLSAVCRTAQECSELVRWFGSPEFCPDLPVMVMVPGTDAPVLIAGMSYASAAELQDCAIVTWFDHLDKLAKRGHVLDYDALREEHGLLPREQVDGATRQALRDRVARHRANPISDPPRQPEPAQPATKTSFAVGKKVTDA